MKLLIIFNPKAAHGRSVNKLAGIREKFERLEIVTQFMPTRHPGHGRELVAAADLSGFDGIVAAGGDGTVFEVVNGLYERPESARLPLGLLPIGTGNAFARELDLQPGAWSEAIDILNRRRTRRMDVAHVKTADQAYYYLNIVVMGFGVKASLTAKKLKFFGDSAYTLATLWQVLKLKSYPLELEIDGRLVHSDNVFVTISNSRYTGTHFLIAPGARIDDGLLDITLLKKLRRSRLLGLFPTIYDGRHVEHEEISTHQARNIVIRSPGGMLMGPDGEFCGVTPAEINCLPRDLSIFY